MKRGQLSSEVFVYILTVAIVGLILVMGYNYISSTKDVVDKGEILQFKNKLASDVQTVRDDYGRVKKGSYSIPSNLNEICFVDLDNVDYNDIVNHPIIKDSVESDVKKNIFLIGENSFESSYVEGFQLSYWPFYSCFQSTTTQTKISLEGTGDAAVLETPYNEKWCKNADDANLCNQLPKVFVGSGYKKGCCDEYDLCCP